MSEPVEVFLGDYALLLEGRVVEVLSKAGTSDRFHVNHVAVAAKGKRDGSLKLHVGIEAGGVVQQGVSFGVDASREAEVMAFFEEAKARRDQGASA